MNNTKLLKKILFVLGNDCQFPREYFKKIAKKLRKDRVYSSSRNFLSKYQQSNHIRRNSQKFKIGKHSRKNKYSRSSSNSDSASSKHTSGSSSSTSSSCSETSDSEEISSGENLKVNQNVDSDETQSDANNLKIDSDCIELTGVSGHKLINRKKLNQGYNANNLNFLQQKIKSKKEMKKGNELIFQKQKMFNLYNFKNSGSKFSNDIASNTLSAISSANNPNTINANNTSDSAEVVGDGDSLEKSKFVNVLNENKIDILENRKSKKLKTNLIDRFNRNTEAEECKNKQLYQKNQANKMFNDRVKTYLYSLLC